VLKVDQIRDEERCDWPRRLLETENRRLAELVLKQREEIASLKGETPEALQQKLALLEQQLARATAQMFGSSSERRDNAEPKTEPKSDKPPRKGTAAATVAAASWREARAARREARV